MTKFKDFVVPGFDKRVRLSAIWAYPAWGVGFCVANKAVTFMVGPLDLDIFWGYLGPTKEWEERNK